MRVGERDFFDKAREKRGNGSNREVFMQRVAWLLLGLGLPLLVSCGDDRRPYHDGRHHSFYRPTYTAPYYRPAQRVQYVNVRPHPQRSYWPRRHPHYAWAGRYPHVSNYYRCRYPYAYGHSYRCRFPRRYFYYERAGWYLDLAINAYDGERLGLVEDNLDRALAEIPEETELYALVARAQNMNDPKPALLSAISHIAQKVTVVEKR